MFQVIFSLLQSLRSALRTRAELQSEIVALRHQLNVLHRNVHRPKLRSADRWLWIVLTRIWRNWRSALVIVKPETVINWHRQGFRLYWAWKSRCRPGRPTVAVEIRRLIRTMNEANPTWGAPRIHGELLKLGIDISEATVSRYMPNDTTPAPTRRPPQLLLPRGGVIAVCGYNGQGCERAVRRRNRGNASLV
jgi:putative transposase